MKANIDGEVVEVFGSREAPNIHLNLTITGAKRWESTYAIHPAFIPVVKAFLRSLSAQHTVGWIEE